MTGRIDPSLGRVLSSLSLPGVLVGLRLIALGDEEALYEAEARSMPSNVRAALRASGSARIVARDLLAQLGFAECVVPKTASGAPLWPAGVVGSLAHDETVAVAAVALRRDVSALGIDVEPAEPLPADVLDLIASQEERAMLGDDPCAARLLFAAKEAVYKAVHPLDGLFLEFPDIAVDFASGAAITRNGRSLALALCRASHLVAVAFIRHE
jgi:4'-phosphopantetheinyl transferase EntD